MVIATGGALAIHAYSEAVGVMVFYKIGELLQNRAVDGSRRSITALLAARPEKAVVQNSEGFRETVPELVKIGETIMIKPGEKIQSVREMAASIQVNPNTVMRTYSYLQEQEIIFNKRGIGYFVSETAYEKTRAMRKKDFIQQYLPEFFKTMKLLKMDFNDLEEIYKNQLKEQEN